MPHLAPFAHRIAGGRCAVHLATNVHTLNAALEGDCARTRLISVCSGVIVSPEQLLRLGLVAYNIHPGTPDYPGVLPEYWAHDGGAETFGATLHAMVDEIDAGPIVETRTFHVPKGVSAEWIGAEAHAKAIGLFADRFERLILRDAPLPINLTAQWTGPYRSKADFRARFGGLPAPRLVG